MKRIKMKTLSTGPGGTMEAGKTYPVDDQTAQELVVGGYAEYCGNPQPKEETATKQMEPEKAVKEKAIHLGGGWYEYKGEKMRKKDLPEGVL